MPNSQRQPTGPLAGIKIVDLTTIIMGPYATQILGDMGADIIKVERPTGDVLRYSNQGRSKGMSNIFLNNNRNKRSLVLDLKQTAGKEALFNLIKKSDVLVSNVRTQAMARLGLSYEAIKVIKPDIVYLSCIGFGQQGPYAKRPAYDDLIQAMAGFPNLFTKAYGSDPTFIPSNLCDRITGLNVVNGITAALLYRERTGQGQAVEIPMFETLLQFLFADHLGGYTFVPSEPSVGYERIVNPNRKPHRTADGGFIALLVYNDKQWAEFLTLIDRPDLVGQGIFATHAIRGQNFKDVYGFVSDMIASRPTAEWADLLGRSDIPHSVVVELEDLFDDEHLQAIDYFHQFEHPSEGTLRTTAIPSQWSESQPNIWRHAPQLGEQSREVLTEIGYTEAEIGTLVENGVTNG